MFPTNITSSYDEKNHKLNQEYYINDFNQNNEIKIFCLNRLNRSPASFPDKKQTFSILSAPKPVTWQDIENSFDPPYLPYKNTSNHTDSIHIDDENWRHEIINDIENEKLNNKKTIII